MYATGIMYTYELYMHTSGRLVLGEEILIKVQIFTSKPSLTRVDNILIRSDFQPNCSRNDSEEQ